MTKIDLLPSAKIVAITMFYFLAFVIPASAATAPSGTATGEATPGDVIALILYIFLALFFSFLCSIAEAVLLNITPSYIADLQSRKPKYAEKVKTIRQVEVDKSLAAILTMNTIAHTVGAIGSGAKATIVFGNAWFGVFSAIMTLLILFLSEIIPKTVGVVFWRQLVRPVISYISILSTILYPFIWISETITRAIAKGKAEHIFNTDEFVAMAGVGEEMGAINKGELRIIQNLFQLSTLTAQDICTPRSVIIGYNQDMTVSEVLEDNVALKVSRLPIHEGDLDKITGFILKDDLLLLKSQGMGSTPIRELRHDLIAVPTTYRISSLMQLFLDQRQQIALVVDDFGTKGLVTIEDVLESLLGTEIVDEDDTVEDMRAHAKEVWEERIESMVLSESDENEDDEVTPDEE